MASNSVPTGGAGRLRIEATETGYSAAGNWSDITWRLYLDEVSSSPLTYVGSPVGSSVGANVNGENQGNLWVGSFVLDWRPAGLQSTLIAEGTTRFGHRADGTTDIYVEGRMEATGTAGAGGPTTVGVWVPWTLLKVLPNVPTGLTATRVSDTQASLSWSQTSATNGRPTQHRIQRRVNGGAWETVVTISATTSATVATAANQKIEYRVAAINSVGTTANSAVSTPIYTTPVAPSGATASKGSSLDITVAFTPNVAYAEHEHEVQHGVVSGGVTTWDPGILATLGSGVSSYVHVAPNSAQVHIYRVRAKTGALTSGWNESNSVQLLVAPNKPTMFPVPNFADRALARVFSWVHNAVDTTPQTAYEFARSTDGGSTWTSTGKVVSPSASVVVAGGSYPPNVTLSVRVRTWGSATTGGSEGTGASPWSDMSTVTFKTAPTTSITAPPNSSTINDSTVRVNLNFAQAEGASFVSSNIELRYDGVILEERTSNVLLGTVFTTRVQNGETYTLRARVQDSNGLWSPWVTSSFDVAYLPPVSADVTVSYLEDQGFGQLDLSIPAPGGGESAAVTVSIYRSIDGGPLETVVEDYPVEAEMTFLDTTPVIRGTNTYTVITKTALGAEASVVEDLVTTECRRAFLSKGAGFGTVVVFGANLSVGDNLSVASNTVSAAGRTRPIGLYGVETSVQLKVSSFVFTREGFSTLPELRDFLLIPGKACYRDSSGRRVFGSVKGSVSYKKVDRGDLSFTLTETD